MAKRIPDHNAHLKLADGFHATRRQFISLAESIWKRFPKAHRVSRQIDKINKEVGNLQNMLDCEYHRVTQEGEFHKSGHVYYNDLGTKLTRDLADWLFSLEFTHHRFRVPSKGELFIGLYRDDGSVRPILLWSDPQCDLFYDVGLRQHVKPPAFYLRIDGQNQAAANLGVTQLTFAGID